MNNLSLYIHIPFCVRKCHYCDFLSAPCNEETKQKYVDALCMEVSLRAGQFKNKKVDTVFFGGGTPSLLSSEQISQIMSVIRKEFLILPEAEISMEMNPGTVEKRKLEVYKKLGINRLSIGLQSANNEELKKLGRIHTWEDFLRTWNMVREAGFGNVNIDLMSALPGQTLESYEETLRKVMKLKPEHISAYSLIIEEGTSFYEWYGEEKENHFLPTEKERKPQNAEEWKSEKSLLGESVEELPNDKLYGVIKNPQGELPDEITDRKMYELTKKLLEEQGYYRYEISNYALRGYECKHNIGYWKRKEYLGLGLGAASLLFMEQTENCGKTDRNNAKNIRCSNITDLEQYLKIEDEPKKKVANCKVQKGGSEKAISEVKEAMLQKGITESKNKELEKEEFGTRERWLEEVTELSIKEQMEEFMFLGLRMMEGISSEEFKTNFGQDLIQVYGEQIEKLEKQDLLEFREESGRYALTTKGIDVSNQVFVEFI